MAKNVCPRCREVILSLGSETDIKCGKCETSFKVNNKYSEDVYIEENKE